MTDKAYHGVYVPEGDGTPEALFKDADKAQQYRKATFGDRGVVAPTSNWGVNADVRDAIAVQAPPPDSSALDARRAEVRSRIWRELEEEELEKEVREETEKSFRESQKQLKGGTKEAKAAKEAQESQEEAELRSRAAIDLGKPPEKVTKTELKEFKEKEEAAASSASRSTATAGSGSSGGSRRR